jgi:hypothetical protein
VFSLTSTGSFKKTEAFLAKAIKKDIYSRLDQYGRMGVMALSNGTPMNTGLTATSWYYKINKKGDVVTIEWRNDHMAGETGTPVAILLQYGHGTRSGGFVQGRDFINPAIKPVMDQIAADVWKVVTS